MPAVRASTWVNTTSTTGTTIVPPLPEYQQNDLLLAIIVADTGTATWSSPGWAHVTGSPVTNTAQMAVMWKIAGASETDPTFTASAGETFNCTLVSIRDVNTTSPFGSPAVQNFATQAAAAKYTMQQISTNVNNALVIYAVANSGAGVPSFIEGPVFGLTAADGAAESQGVGWTFRPTAGPTPNNITVSNIATGAGVRAAIQIAPPAGGATVIPTYCAADLSTYLDPINGVTAYNGNTAIAATADTGFGTTLGGVTAADAAVAAAADVGINSFHSCARVTSISASKNMAGVELVFAVANRPNITGKNILVHVGPSTEGQLQRFASVATGRGMWFGARSGAASNYKIWQVYGVELGSTRHQPVVINELNTTGLKATNGTLAPSSVLAFGFWISGNGVTTTIWDFAQLWMLDTTTIAGGNAAEPVGIAGIVAAAATGHERKSVLRQGANQALVLQPLQFGDGGTNPIYLDLDATAIEFPRQFNDATFEVTYCSVDNVAGLTYYAGATDTIKHRNSVISSASDYHWRIHASSSASATYDFSGLSLIGAGDVVLRNVTTFNNMSFVSCTTITQNSAPITNSSFTNSFLMCNNPAALSNNSFTSGGTGHAIQITTPGTYTFTGNTFSGYGIAGSVNAAIYNNSGGAVVLNITGGGSTPTVRNGTSATTTVNSNVSITLTGLKANSEIRVYTDNAGQNDTLIDGVENSGTSFTFSVAASTVVNIMIHHLNYLRADIWGLNSGTSDSSIPVSQFTDRNYANT